LDDCAQSIYCANATNNTISNNQIVNNRNFAIFGFTGSSSNVITGNTIANALGHGIYWIGTNSTISNNTLDNPGDANSEYGFYIDGINNTVSGNVIFSASYYSIYVTNTDNTITGNTIKSSEDVSIYCTSSRNSITNNIIDNSLDHGIILSAGASNNTVNSNILYSPGDAGGEYGIYVEGSKNTVTSNTIDASSDVSINVSGSNNIIASNNIDASGTHGILVTSSNNTIEGNNIYDAGNAAAEYSIAVLGGLNSILGNAIELSENAAILVSTDHNTIANNSIDAYTEHGIHLLSTANKNNISDNMLYHNNTDAASSYAIYIEGAKDNIISGNLIESPPDIAILLENSALRNNVTNNNIYDADDHAIHLTPLANHCKIIGNTMHAPGSAVGEYGIFNEATSTEIADNTITSALDDAIYSTGEHSIISGNRIDLGVDNGIYVLGDYSVITGNVITDCIGIGLNMDVASDNCSIASNISRDNAGVEYLINGSNHSFLGNHDGAGVTTNNCLSCTPLIWTNYNE